MIVMKIINISHSLQQPNEYKMLHTLQPYNLDFTQVKINAHTHKTSKTGCCNYTVPYVH